MGEPNDGLCSILKKTKNYQYPLNEQIIPFVENISRDTEVKAQEYTSHVHRHNLEKTEPESTLFVIAQVNAALHAAVAGLEGALDYGISDSEMAENIQECKQVLKGAGNMARYGFRNGMFKRRGCEFSEDVIEWEYKPFEFEVEERRLRRFHRFLDGKTSKAVSKTGVEFKYNGSIPVENWGTIKKMALMMRSQFKKEMLLNVPQAPAARIPKTKARRTGAGASKNQSLVAQNSRELKEQQYNAFREHTTKIRKLTGIEMRTYENFRPEKHWMLDVDEDEEVLDPFVSKPPKRQRVEIDVDAREKDHAYAHVINEEASRTTKEVRSSSAHKVGRKPHHRDAKGIGRKEVGRPPQCKDEFEGQSAQRLKLRPRAQKIKQPAPQPRRTTRSTAAKYAQAGKAKKRQ